MLEGGAGADVFRFLTLADSANAAMDTITDFELGLDRIDLSRIDALAGALGNQAFTFIGSAAFTAAGQVRAVSFGADFQVQMNTAGSDGAEMTLLTSDLTGIAVGDFIL
jgi:Ca2+-binding RTX toxin-like protein